MALVVAAQLVAQIVGSSITSDVETDTNTAVEGEVNVLLPSSASDGGFLTFRVPGDVLAQLAHGPCTVVISQGAGTLDVPTSA